MATILVADDRPLNRQYLVTLLGYYGHRIVEASDGLEALKLARSERPGLVISDLVMPLLDGQELAKLLRSDPDCAGIPIVFYSAVYNLRQAQTVAREVGALDVLPKPSDPEKILEIVNTALGITSSAGGAPQLPSPQSVVLAAALPDQLADLEAISQRLAAFIELSLELAAERDPQGLLQGVARAARSLIGAKDSAVGLRHEDGQFLTLFVSTGTGKLPAGTTGAVLMPAGTPYTVAVPPDSVMERLMNDSAPMRLSTAERSQLALELSLPSQSPAGGALLGIPFPKASTARGFLLLAGKLGAEDFTGEDIRVASTLASQGALAYDRLHERLTAEENTRKSRAMFETLFESAPDAMLATDVQGTITYVNSQTERMFGHPRSQLLGQPIEILVPQRFREAHQGLRQGFQHEPRLRPMGTGAELCGRRKDGSEFPVDIMLSPMEAAEGRLVLSVIRDNTRRKQNEDRILELNRELQWRVRQLQAANQSLETFSYSVSHDLRTPLRAIEGFAAILAEDYGPVFKTDARRLLDTICSNCHKMGKLIDDLLSFSRVTHAGLQESEVDMTALAQSVVDELSQSDPARQIQTTVHALAPALADRSLVRQVFVNLVSNAWKFTRPKPQASIEIGCCPRGSTVAYLVKDTGVGFNPEFSAKLFGVFERLHSNEEFAGTGIGLAIVRRIVERHGGEVWATGEVGEGATFFFTLARPDAVVEPDAASPTREEPYLLGAENSPAG